MELFMTKKFTLLTMVRNVLLAWDPIGIYFDDAINLDEYDYEAGYIASKLPKCKSRLAVRSMIFNHFVIQFGRSFTYEGNKAKRVTKNKREEIKKACQLGLRRSDANRVGDLLWSLMAGRPEGCPK